MKNAARVSDFHSCPQVDAKPHVGGPVLPPGAANVLIDGLPAARVGDPALCMGAPDAIKKGAPEVYIEGARAARRGDGTLHGGVVMVGSPQVMIGGTAPCKSQAETLEEAMNQIRSSDWAQTPEGKKVLAKLEQLQREGRLSYEDLPPGVDGRYNADGSISVSDRLSQNPDATARELVHEGTHAEIGSGPDGDSIDEESQAKKNGVDYYDEQRSADAAPNDEFDQESQANKEGKLRDLTRQKYGDKYPEHAPR